jgi:hypothetical protein
LGSDHGRPVVPGLFGDPGEPPAGVGPVGIGDHLEAYLEGRKMLDFYVR